MNNQPHLNSKNSRPKIGLALSGASGRAIAHIGVLEVLKEYNVPIDYITACSSGTVVAASFACGTMEELKHNFFELDREALFRLFQLDDEGSGLFSLEKTEEAVRKFTLGKNFEEVEPRLSFIACDVKTGEPVSMSLGDLARACRISCSIPFLFPPVLWGNRVLVDGGLFTMVPVKEVQEMGADIVVGVDIAATRYAFKKRYIHVWRGYSFLKRTIFSPLFGWFYWLLSQIYQSSIKVVYYSQSDFLEERFVDKNPNLLTMLGRALEIASLRHRSAMQNIPTCDIMLSPKVKHYGKIGFEHSRKMYKEGRRVAEEAIPEIKKLIKDYQWRNRH